jgi:hypothetical protein
MAQKADARDMELIATRDDLMEVRDKTENMAKNLREKVDGREFAEFEGHMGRKMQDVADQMVQKSNIKDVCALLDMKSNIDDVNKALADTHEEVESRVAIRDFK